MAVETDVCPVSQVQLLKPPRVYLWSQTHKLLRVSSLKHASFSALAWELRVCACVCVLSHCSLSLIYSSCAQTMLAAATDVTPYPQHVYFGAVN